MSKKLKTLQTLTNAPRVYVADHFYAIRNELDYAAESLLIKLESEALEGSSLPETGDQKLQKLTNSAIVNQIRDQMIEELKLYEGSCLKRLEERSSAIAIVASRLEGYKQKNEELGAKAEDEATDLWTEECGSLSQRLDAEISELKEVLLSNKTVFFHQAFLNELGALVIFENLCLSDEEIDFLK